MSFTEFLEEHDSNANHVTLKHEGGFVDGISDLLLKDIEIPDFYDHIADVWGVTLY